MRTKCETGNRNFLTPRMTLQVVCYPKDAKLGIRGKSTFCQITGKGENGIIHYGA